MTIRATEGSVRQRHLAAAAATAAGRACVDKYPRRHPSRKTMGHGISQLSTHESTCMMTHVGTVELTPRVHATSRGFIGRKSVEPRYAEAGLCVN